MAGWRWGIAEMGRRHRIDYKRDYPANWHSEIRPAVLSRAGNRCEGSPRYPDCRAENGRPHPVTGSAVVLTIAHLYEDDKATQDLTRLRAWCNRCHLLYDIKQHVRNAAITRRMRRIEAGQLEMEARS